MEPSIYSFKIQRNADYPLTLQFLDEDLTPIDLTGYTVIMTIYSLGKVSTLVTPTITYDSRPEGTVTALLARADNAQLPNEAMYDVILVDPSDLHLPYLEGTITVEL